MRRVVRVSLAASARHGSAICIHAGVPIHDDITPRHLWTGCPVCGERAGGPKPPGESRNPGGGCRGDKWMAGFAGWHGVGVPFGGHARCAGMAYLNHWIPAFAGMTVGDSGLRRNDGGGFRLSPVVTGVLGCFCQTRLCHLNPMGVPINDGGRLTGIAGCDRFPALLPAFQDAVGSRRPC